MRLQRLATALAFLQLMTALAYDGIYSLPFRTFGTFRYWTPMNFVDHSLAALFVVLPVLGLAGVLKGWRPAFAALALWPAVAFVFGVIPLPFGHLLYPTDAMASTVIVATIDFLAFGLALWLFRATQPLPSAGLRPDAGPVSRLEV